VGEGRFAGGRRAARNARQRRRRAGDARGGAERPHWISHLPPEGNAFEAHTAAEVMSRRLVWIAPGATLREAAAAMRRAAVHRLLVLDDGRLAGLVTATDVMGAVADGRLSGGPDA